MSRLRTTCFLLESWVELIYLKAAWNVSWIGIISWESHLSHVSIRINVFGSCLSRELSWNNFWTCSLGRELNRKTYGVIFMLLRKIFTEIWKPLPLTRAGVAVSATFALVVGGGVKMATPPISKAKRDKKGREKAFKCSQWVHSRVFLGFFFAQVNIEITRGHQRPNLVECHIISSNMCDNLRTYYR